MSKRVSSSPELPTEEFFSIVLDALMNTRIDFLAFRAQSNSESLKWYATHKIEQCDLAIRMARRKILNGVKNG